MPPRKPDKPHRLKVHKDLRAEIRALRRAGWTITVGGRHPKLTCPAGAHSVPIPTNDLSHPLREAWRGEIRRHQATCP